MPANRIVINGVEQIDPRHTRAWRRLRDQVVREEPTCRLRITDVCTTVSTTAAHIVAVRDRPELTMERTNLEGSCAPCNRAAGTLSQAAVMAVQDPRSEALSIFRKG
jgi:5-methylcytosine-specific restriction endonuclease McrA